MKRSSLLLGYLCVLMLGGIALAQPQPAVVTGTGRATIKSQPDLLRVSVSLVGEGKDTAEAVAKLAQERESAKKKLADLGAVADSVHISDPTVGVSAGEADDPRVQQIQQMMVAMGRGAKKTAPKGVKVSAMLEAQWPLKAASPDDRLVESVALMDKIKVAFTRTLTSEEQEIQEEMRSNGMPSTPGQANPGEPKFIFVHKITTEERAKATTDAMTMARGMAARLAQAVGGKLGPPRQISEQSAGSQEAGDAESIYVAQYLGRLAGSTSLDEATASQPGPVSYTAMVSVGFTLE